MNLVKTSFYTSISTGVTFICGFIVAKVVAVRIGPAGIALVGQFQNTTAILLMLGSGGINMGVVKYLSEKHSSQSDPKPVVSTSLGIVAICSLLIGIVCISAASELSKLAFYTTKYSLVYVAFGTCIVFATFNTLANSIFNGFQDIRKLTTANVFFSIVGIFFTIIFAYLWGVMGVLIATNATAVSVFLFNLFLLKKIPNVRNSLRLRKPNKEIASKLFTFSIMTFFSTMLLPIIQLLIRNKIIHNFSVAEAGYWQGVTKISDYYLSFITTVLGVYYLPKLSGLQEKSELSNEVIKGFKIILPSVAGLAAFIWLFRHQIILLLFTRDFLPMESLFTFQLLGDILKIASWLMGFLMWAKAMAKTYIITELILSTSLVVLSYLLVNAFGLIGATYAFALNSLLSFITTTVLMNKYVLREQA